MAKLDRQQGIADFSSNCLEFNFLSLPHARVPLSSTHLVLPWKQIAFTTKKDYGKEEREAQWVFAQRTLHGLQPPDASGILDEKSSYRELSEIAEQAKRRAEMAR